MGAHTWVAHTAFAYGRMLLRRGDPRAAALLGEAAALAQRFGMAALLARIPALGVGSPSRGAPCPTACRTARSQVLAAGRRRA